MHYLKTNIQPSVRVPSHRISKINVSKQDYDSFTKRLDSMNQKIMKIESLLNIISPPETIHSQNSSPEPYLDSTNVENINVMKNTNNPLYLQIKELQIQLADSSSENRRKALQQKIHLLSQYPQ